MHTAKSHLLRFWFFLFFFPVALCISELSIRYFNLKEIGEPRHDVVESSYMPAKLKANYQGSIMGLPFSTNTYGFRDETDFWRVPEKDEFRILSLGDSIGVGLGVKASAHYTKALENIFNQQGLSHRFRVINAGGKGYSPSSYYVYLKQEGVEFEPRMVMVQIELCNDITDEALLKWEVQEGNTELPQAVRGGRYVVGWDGNLLGTYSLQPYFFEKTYTYTLLLKRILRLLYQWHPTEPFHSEPGVTYYRLDFEKFLLGKERLESGWTKMFGALEGTHRFLRERGISFLLLIFPSRYMFEDVSGEHRNFSRQLVERAVELAREKKLPYLDFTATMEDNGGAGLYFDFAHPTEEGNQIIADRLAAHLMAENFTPSSVEPRISREEQRGQGGQHR